MPRLCDKLNNYQQRFSDSRRTSRLNLIFLTVVAAVKEFQALAGIQLSPAAASLCKMTAESETTQELLLF